MSAANFLSRLDRVRKTGPNRWTARCPAHEDRSPSLTISELDTGKVLIKCHAGCEFEQVIGAVGVEASEMFPQREKDFHYGKWPRFNAHDVLECLSNEARIAAVASANLARGMTLSEVDRARLFTAATRLESGRRLANGEH